MAAEDILCVSRELLPAEFLQNAGACAFSLQKCKAVLEHAHLQWHSRSLIENDARYKQIIPYTLIMTEEGLCATYCRAGTEKRLHGLRSLGIGGHVARYDSKGADGVFEAVFEGLRRELAEEMPGAEMFPPEFLSVINEEKTPVGTVHLGLVFLVKVPDARICRPGRELGDFRWQSLRELLNGGAEKEYELWSQLALGLMRF